jgi:hypothetical protein
VTRGLAAAASAPLAPPRLAEIWMCDATAGADRLRLRPVERANVLLIDWKGDAVFEGATQREEYGTPPPARPLRLSAREVVRRKVKN